MKRLILVALLLFVGTHYQCQSIVLNQKLLMQLSKNQEVRLLSNQKFLNSYEKQRKLYEDANKKIAQIVAVHEYIYQNLNAVSSTIKQGKKALIIGEYTGKVLKNLSKVVQLSAKEPQYSALLTAYHKAVYLDAINIQQEVRDYIEKRDSNFLMDTYDRELMLSGILTKIQLMNGTLLYIIHTIEDGENYPYINQIPKLGYWVSLDKMIFRDIVNKYKYVFKY